GERADVGWRRVRHDLLPDELEPPQLIRACRERDASEVHDCREHGGHHVWIGVALLDTGGMGEQDPGAVDHEDVLDTATDVRWQLAGLEVLIERGRDSLLDGTDVRAKQEIATTGRHR